MDISAIKASARTVEILHPSNSEPTGLEMDIVSMNDDRVKKVRRAHQNKRLQSRNKNVTAEQLEAEAIDLLSAAVTGWRWNGDASFHGEKPEFTPEKVKQVIREVDFIRDQVDSELGLTSAFYQG